MDKIVDVYVDLLVIDQQQTKNLDSLKYHKEQVYSKYGITKSEFEDAFLSFKTDEEKWDKFFDMAITRVDTLEAIRKRNDTK